MADSTAGDYVVVVPVKPPALGKSRLRGLPDDLRRDLAAAFALDTVTACLQARSVARVLVATDDVDIIREVTAMGCATTPDAGRSGLNAVLRQAAGEAVRRWPVLVPVALCADLPALLATDLGDVLAQVPREGASFVGDADGTGTTLFTAPAVAFEPRFGAGSWAAHERAGARELAAAPASVRRDVDDLDGLRAALALGVGPATSAVLPRLHLT